MSSAPAQALPEWVAISLPWLVALCALAAAATGVGVWMLLRELRGLAKLGERLAVLDDIRATLARVAKEREDLDLRRLEHVLIELRDGQRRLEDLLLRSSQLSTSAPASPVPSASAIGLSERIVQRLLAQGFERVQVVPSLEELAKLADSGAVHEVPIEARRNGVLCKGRAMAS
jgi:hypothetical protein